VVAEESSDINKVIAEVSDSLATVEQEGKKKVEIILAKDVPQRRKAGLEERYYSKPMYTFYPGFDKFLSVGFAPGKLSVIAGRTAMGKSFFKANLIINQCQHGIEVVNICPEQGFDSEHDRIDSITTGIHLETLARIRDLQLDDPKFQSLNEQSERIAKWNYACIPSRGLSVADVGASLRKIKRSGMKPQIVYIDLFDRLNDVNVAKDRTGTMARKLLEIEAIAEEEAVHMCLLVQVNRGTEARKDHRPTLADLKDCGNFEQDADNIFLLYREGYYNRELEDNILDVEIAKQRGGMGGVVYQFMITDKKTLSIAALGEKRFVETQNKGESSE
jgi:replicative DNA helicase